MQKIIYIAVIVLLVKIAYIDYKQKIIPDKLNLMIFILGIINIMQNFKNIKIYILSTIIVFSFFFILAVLSNGGIGGGDIKLFTALCLIFGHDMIYIIKYTYVMAAAVSIIMLVFKKSNLKSSIALAPFIALGTLTHFIL